MKKYFHSTMYYLTAALILFMVLEIYDVIAGNDIAISTWEALDIIRLLIFISFLGLFIKFITLANRNQLFSKISSRLWTYKSTLLLMVAVLSFIELRFEDGNSLLFASSIFLASFCFAMSKIFREATLIKQENDLTI